jgi:hypothetical protein
LNRENVNYVKLYECSSLYTGKPAINSGDCYSNSYIQSYCSAIIVYWTKNGETLVELPVDTGYPIGAGSGYSYVVLELSYQHANLESEAYIDSFTLQLHLTDQLRPNELGSLMLGADADPTSILIPPSLKHFPIASYCFNECIRSVVITEIRLENFIYVCNLFVFKKLKLDSGSITFVMAYPHTKSSGKQVFTRIIRNGTDRGYLHNNKQYNPQLQNYYMINPPIQIEQVK